MPEPKAFPGGCKLIKLSVELRPETVKSCSEQLFAAVLAKVNEGVNVANWLYMVPVKAGTCPVTVLLPSRNVPTTSRFAAGVLTIAISPMQSHVGGLDAS